MRQCGICSGSLFFGQFLVPDICECPIFVRIHAEYSPFKTSPDNSFIVAPSRPIHPVARRATSTPFGMHLECEGSVKVHP